MLHADVLHDFYLARYVIGVEKLQESGWAGPVARIGRTEIYGIFFRKR